MNDASRHTCFLAPEWCVLLIQEWARKETTAGLGLPRVNPMWSASHDAGGEDSGEREELKALSAAVERLRAEAPAMHAAFLEHFKRRGSAADQGDLRAAVHLLAEWVDEAVGD